VNVPNQSVIERFYSAFNDKDGDTMAACYAPAAKFNDPVFGDLDGGEAGDMWRMLTGRAKDLRVELLEHSADGERGTAHWRAHYTFVQTGRQVVNDVQAKFHFAGGLIDEHIDDFDFYGWSRQAFGPRGLILGWTPVMRKAVQSRAREGLEEFRAGS
jgi:ketosteroid isomerase-like protein